MEGRWGDVRVDGRLQLVAESAYNATTLPQDLYLANVKVVIPDGFTLPKYAHLSFSNCTFDVRGSMTLDSASLDLNGHFAFAVPGDLVVKGAGAFAATSAPTNGTDAAEWNDFTGSVTAYGGENGFASKNAATEGSVYWELQKGLMLFVR